MAKTNKTRAKAGTKAGAEGGTDNTDTSLNGEFRAGAGIYVNASGEWTDPNGTVLRGKALMEAEANASAIDSSRFLSAPKIGLKANLFSNKRSVRKIIVVQATKPQSGVIRLNPPPSPANKINLIDVISVF